MYLTTESLKKYGLCDSNIAYFKRRYPDGAPLIDVIADPKITPQLLHWGFNNLPSSAEERLAYYEKLNIHCDNNNYSIYESDNIINSYAVSRCSRVSDSDFVSYSSDVNAANNVTFSNVVEHSGRVYNSSFVFNSEKVVRSENITNSHNIVCSSYVLDSDNVFNSLAVTNSHFVTALCSGGSENITDSWFIHDGKNINHCLFCSELSDAEYCLFNKPIVKLHYENIVKQLGYIIAPQDELCLVDNWPVEQLPLSAGRINRNIIVQYESLPDKFWRWVKTLPGYDPKVLYTITYQPELLRQ